MPSGRQKMPRDQGGQEDQGRARDRDREKEKDDRNRRTDRQQDQHRDRPATPERRTLYSDRMDADEDEESVGRQGQRKWVSQAEKQQRSLEQMQAQADTPYRVEHGPSAAAAAAAPVAPRGRPAAPADGPSAADPAAAAASAAAPPAAAAAHGASAGAAGSSGDREIAVLTRDERARIQSGDMVEGWRKEKERWEQERAEWELWRQGIQRRSDATTEAEKATKEWVLEVARKIATLDKKIQDQTEEGQRTRKSSSYAVTQITKKEKEESDKGFMVKGYPKEMNAAARREHLDSILADLDLLDYVKMADYYLPSGKPAKYVKVDMWNKWSRDLALAYFEGPRWKPAMSDEEKARYEQEKDSWQKAMYPWYRGGWNGDQWRNDHKVWAEG